MDRSALDLSRLVYDDPAERWEPLSPLSAHIGPQRAGETLFARRVRLHQCWYRVAVLGLREYGTTPLGKPLGSILAERDAGNGLNFTSDAARALFQKRRSEGWGVDPTRCTSHMTSSQALTINMFGPLASDQQWLTRTLQLLLDRRDVEAEGVRLEYAPNRRSQHLGDQTRVDVLVALRSSHGPQALVFEVKYGDRFNSRAVSISTQRYLAFAATSRLWTQGQVPASPAINQLVRVHALATSAIQREQGPDAQTELIALLHDADVSGWGHVREYGASLNNPQLCRGASHGTFLGAMLHASGNASQRRMVEALKVRYTEQHMSEDLWTEHRGKAPTGTGGGDRG